MHTQVNRKKISSNAGSAGLAAQEARNSIGNKPNSAMLAAASGQGSGGASSDDLGKRLNSRVLGVQEHRQAQIPQAEGEADRISASVTSGTPESVKAAMGRRMGADFSGVRFHTGADAAAKADSMGARAYTSGADVYFDRSGFDPSVAAHELVHTAQQGIVESSMPTMSTPAGGVQMKPKFSWNPFKKSGNKKQQQALAAEAAQVARAGQASRAGQAAPAAPQAAPAAPQAAPAAQQAPAAPLINTGKFKFNSFAYRNDEELKEFKQLLDNFNKGGASAEDEIKLMQSAYSYIDKHSTGVEAKHKGRTSMMEDVLYQLTMRGGTKDKANANIQRFRDSIVDANEDNYQVSENYINGLKTQDEIDKKKKEIIGIENNFRNGGRVILDNLKNIYDPADASKNTYSKTLQMITADVMSKQNKTRDYIPGGSSGSSRYYEQDGNGGENSYYKVLGRVGSGTNDAIGTNLHEFTHVASGEAFNNSDLFSTFEVGANKDDVAKEAIHRTARANELKQLASQQELKGKKLGFDDLSDYVSGRAAYATSQKYKSQYVPSKKNAMLVDFLTAEGQKDANKEFESSLNEKRKEKPVDEYIREMNAGTRRGGILDNEQTRNRLNDNNSKINNFSDIADYLKNDEKYKDQNGSMDTMIEYDSVINQMLAQYENGFEDKDSQFYRKLKSAALRSHVQRRAAALRRGV